MNRLLAPLCALALLAACGKKEPDPAAPAAPPTGSAPRPETAANGEPAAVTVKHVLIQFQGSLRSGSTRTQEEAQRVAYDALGRAKQGEDFDKLMKELSDDKGGGTYTLTNDGVPANPGTSLEFDRKNMSKAFGDVAFRIGVNEIGFADYDSQNGKFGFHIIKRIK